MKGLDDFRNELDRELVAAAYRKHNGPEQVRSGRFQLSRIIGAVAAAAVVAVAAIGVLVARPDSASAQVFRIRNVGTGTVIDVVDIVEDPDEVVDQLRNEIDLDAEMFAVPVPDKLVGQIVAVASTGDTTPVPEISDLGTVEHVELPNEFDGALLIEYGRPADNSEFYAATVTDPICADLYGASPAEVIDEITALASEVRYEVTDESGRVMVDVPPAQIPVMSGLVDVTYLNSETLVAKFAAVLPSQPERLGCR